MLISSNRPYPYNLIESVFPQYPFQTTKEPSDLKGSVEYLIMKLFDERKQQIIRMRFQERKTLQYVGDVIGVSRDRVRQVEDKMLSTLRKPENSKILLMGLEAAKTDEIKGAVKRAAEMAYIRGYNESQQSIVLTLTSHNGNQKHIPESLYAMPIGKLELSVRSYNCLNRANIRTISDLMAMDAESLCKIRNLGKTSYREIIEKLEDIGLSCEHLKDYSVLSAKKRKRGV